MLITKSEGNMKLMNYKNIERLLINVDMVNGFIKTGPMHDKKIAKIIPAQIDLIEKCNGENDYLIFVKEGHSENATEFKKFPKHCVNGTEEAEIVDELKGYAKNVYEKNSTSAIFAKNFLQTIANMINLKEVIIMGCCTDICVLNLAIPLSNYFDELNREVKITIPKNVVQTYDAPIHNADKYNEMAFTLFGQAGINVVDEYEK